MKKTFFIILSLVVLALPLNIGHAEYIQAQDSITDITWHGGGCRKSSPPGSCCHMDRKTGIVHCH